MRNLLSKKPSSAGAPGRTLPVDPDGRPVLAEQPAAAFTVAAAGGRGGHSESPSKRQRQGDAAKTPQMIYNEHFSGLEVRLLHCSSSAVQNPHTLYAMASSPMGHPA